MQGPEGTAGPREFLLTKWYMDAVAEDGGFLIGYSARLQWRSIRLGYSGVLYRSADGAIRSDSTFRRVELPGAEDERLLWRPDPLRVAGEWRRLQPGIAETLLKSPGGEINWECRFPRAAAEIQLPGGMRLDGVGYAERLTLTFPPWELPFRRLLWGRFHGRRNTLIWIIWQNHSVFNRVYHNGRRCRAVDFDVHGMEFDRDSLRLRFGEGEVLRRGPLNSTVFARIPGIGKLFPPAALQITECKWLARGELVAPQGRLDTGWTIHEEVLWKND